MKRFNPSNSGDIVSGNDLRDWGTRGLELTYLFSLYNHSTPVVHYIKADELPAFTFVIHGPSILPGHYKPDHLRP